MIQDYLEKIAKTGELILLDNNVLSESRTFSGSLAEDIYVCDTNFSFNPSEVEYAINWFDNFIKFLKLNTNIRFSLGVVKEKKSFSDILQGQYDYHHKRLGKIYRRLKKSKKGFIILEDNGPYYLEDYKVDQDFLELLRKFSVSVYKSYNEIRKKQLEPLENFNDVFEFTKTLTKKHGLKYSKEKIDRNLHYKEEHSSNDEELAALAFSYSFNEPVHLVSFDRDILRICNVLWERKAKESIKPRFPVHFHSWVSEDGKPVRYKERVLSHIKSYYFS